MTGLRSRAGEGSVPRFAGAGLTARPGYERMSGLGTGGALLTWQGCASRVRHMACTGLVATPRSRTRPSTAAAEAASRTGSAARDLFESNERSFICAVFSRVSQ